MDVGRDDIMGTVTLPVPFRDGEYALQGKDAQGTFILGNETQRCSFQAWADNLKDEDWIGKSDPYFEIFQGKRKIFESAVLEGSTPVWGEVAFDCAKYARELKVVIYDKDNVSSDKLGECLIPVPIRNNRYSLGDKCGEFIIGEPWKQVKLWAWANNVKGADFLSKKSDPFYVLKTPDGKEIYRSEHINSTQTPQWDLAKFQCPVDSKKLLVEIYDHDLTSKNDLLYSGEIPYPFKNGFYHFKEGFFEFF